MRILIDLDSVLNDLVPAWLGRYNLDYQDELQEHDLLDWETWKFVKEECGTKIYQYLDDPTLFSELQPVYLSRELMRALKRQHEVYVVSAAGHKVMEAKAEWIMKHYEMNISHIIFTSEKYLIDGDVIVDDAPHNVTSFPSWGILYEKPWNIKTREQLNMINSLRIRRIMVAKDWRDIYDIIQRIS